MELGVVNLANKTITGKVVFNNNKCERQVSENNIRIFSSFFFFIKNIILHATVVKWNDLLTRERKILICEEKKTELSTF